MDQSTLEGLADLICGDFKDPPVYRTGGELTRFFHRAGINATHDVSTRKWWTLSILNQLNTRQRTAVIKRLAHPKEYSGNPDATRKAIDYLNQLLALDGFRVVLDGVEPKIGKLKRVASDLDEAKAGLKPLPPPDFLALGLEPGIGSLLKVRWDEAQRCVNAGAYLAAVVMMGGLLEGILLGAMQQEPKTVNQCPLAPKDTSANVKRFREWTLADMIEVAHGIGWLGLDVKKFSHALREFRNLVHPHEQLTAGASPDKDTCDISWLVVQAAVNDVAKVMAAKASQVP